MPLESEEKSFGSSTTYSCNLLACSSTTIGSQLQKLFAQTKGDVKGRRPRSQRAERLAFAPRERVLGFLGLFGDSARLKARPRSQRADN